MASPSSKCTWYGYRDARGRFRRPTLQERARDGQWLLHLAIYALLALELALVLTACGFRP